jgi:hypothetical protein
MISPYISNGGEMANLISKDSWAFLNKRLDIGLRKLTIRACGISVTMIMS